MAGVLHLITPQPFLGITPYWVPEQATVVTLTGIAEICGAIGLLQWHWPALRRAAGWSLAAYALFVWPANFTHMFNDMALPGDHANLAYHLPRLASQPLLIWLALWVGEVTHWPWKR